MPKKISVIVDDFGNVSMPDGTTYALLPGTYEKLENEDRPKQPDLATLIAAGMSADDLIKLKHGGVL